MTTLPMVMAPERVLAWARLLLGPQQASACACGLVGFWSTASDPSTWAPRFFLPRAFGRGGCFVPRMRFLPFKGKNMNVNTLRVAADGILVMPYLVLLALYLMLLFMAPVLRGERSLSPQEQTDPKNCRKLSAVGLCCLTAVESLDFIACHVFPSSWASSFSAAHPSSPVRNGSNGTSKPMNASCSPASPMPTTRKKTFGLQTSTKTGGLTSSWCAKSPFLPPPNRPSPTCC